MADTGSTVGKLKGDVGTAVEALERFALRGLEMKGEIILANPDNLHLTMREPGGVMDHIAPFNHPIYFAAAGTVAALMGWSAVVVKLPEQSPISSTISSEIWKGIFPPGVVHIVPRTGREAIV